MIENKKIDILYDIRINGLFNRIKIITENDFLFDVCINGLINMECSDPDGSVLSKFDYILCGSGSYSPAHVNINVQQSKQKSQQQQQQQQEQHQNGVTREMKIKLATVMHLDNKDNINTMGC